MKKNKKKTKVKQPKDMDVSESLFSDKNKGGPFSWKMKPFKEIYNIKLGKYYLV